MPLAARFALSAAASLFCASLWAAPVGQQEAQAELHAIRALSETSAQQALERLVALQAAAGKDAPYALRRELLRTEVWLREDAGQLDQVYRADREALALALANHDRPGAVLARLGLVKQLVDENRANEAHEELERILKDMPRDAPRELKVTVAQVQGDVLNARGQYDKAIAAFLGSLKLQQDRPDADAAESRAYLQSRIAKVYINADDAGKALETARLGLREPGLPPRTTGSLQFLQGMALLRLDRPAEALAGFRHALATAERGGLAGLEAEVRGNIADYYLRRRDYASAEHEARLALAASQRVNNENLTLMAKANLGFALFGQRRIAEGTPWIDGVIEDLRKAGALADLEAMYDEKSRMQENAGLYKDALATVRLQQQLRQTSARAERDRAIAALQEEFDASQRTRQIEFLHRENEAKETQLRSRRLIQFVTSFAAVLTVLAGAVVFVLYRRAKRSAARLQQLNTQLEFHSLRDALTGLYNRRSFLDKMRARETQGAAERRRPAGDADCFLLMDVDHFKGINDRWGHGVGDAVLVEVARRLTLAVRDTDMVLRWGGEEFLVHAPGTDPAHAGELARRILDAIGGAPVDAGACSVPMTVSAGVIALPGAGGLDAAPDWQQALRLADWALYQGKANGRNQAWIVTGLAAPLAKVLTAIDAADGGVKAAEMIEMRCVRGPVQAG
ncbi:diguanylate cyclase [Massilia sp.]|uniref:tetratricopeptide repeat-containing diguanylate cyclase n=1 Tax=Massilia sp. TaxID=1882437 RepID=UPI0028A70329|nr:diguanylate cyclase [Massilia sp.]